MPDFDRTGPLNRVRIFGRGLGLRKKSFGGCEYQKNPAVILAEVGSPPL